MAIFRLFGSADKAAPKTNGAAKLAGTSRPSRKPVEAGSGLLSSLSNITTALRGQPIDGAALLDDIAAVLRRHIIMAADDAATMALWTLYAHSHEATTIAPLLALVSPEVGCGKSTALSVLAQLVPRPLFVSDVTAAGLYRTITDCQPTLLIDEAETSLLGNKTLRSLINSGHRRGAQVLRADGIFELSCPKAIALVGELPPSLRDRAVVVGLKRKRPTETIAPLNDAARAQLKELAERAEAWARQQFGPLAAAEPALPPSVTNRTADNWRTLAAIADAAGGHWPERARLLATAAAAERDATWSLGIQLLADLRDLFSRCQIERLSTSEIIDMLAEYEERRWRSYDRGRPIAPYQLAKLLRPFGIRPTTLRCGDTTAKGYLLRDFSDAFDRYL